MNVAVFGSFGRRVLAPGWTHETAVSFFGSGDIDLARVEAGNDPRITAVGIFGGIDIIVDEGSRVTMSGFSLFGSRKTEIVAGAGPSLHISAIAIFGSIKVKLPRVA